MFDAICTTCRRRELIFPGQILGVENAPEYIVVTFRCSRGHVGCWHTGRGVTAVREKSAA